MKTAIKKDPRYITDKKGKKLSVVISISEYEKMIEEIEELNDIKLYDAVKSRNEKTIPFKEYLQQKSRRKKHA